MYVPIDMSSVGIDTQGNHSRRRSVVLSARNESKDRECCLLSAVGDHRRERWIERESSAETSLPGRKSSLMRE